MKNVIYFCVFLLLTHEGFTQAHSNLVMGFTDSIQSNILNEQHPLLIYTPYANSKIKLSSKEKFPVLYVIDGEYNFHSVVTIVEQLVRNEACPPMIIVGIANTNRVTDLTPTASEGNSDGLKNTGGGEKSSSFLQKELMPYIESSYPTQPYKILMGHSLGGLMAIHTLIHHKDLFDAYITIDAAIWWDDHKILKQAKLALEKDSYDKKSMFLAIANRMERGIDTTAVQSDTSEKTELIRYNLDLIHKIKKYPKNKLRFNYKYYENESHNTITFITAYDALRYIFDYYAFPKYANYTTGNPQLITVIIVNRFVFPHDTILSTLA